MRIVGDKTVLRPLVNSDFIKYFKWHSNANLRFQTAMHPYPATEQNERDWFNMAINDISSKRFIFTIVNREKDEAIGYFQLTDVNFINRNAMLGIVIGEEEYQGQGLGKEVIKLGIDYGFNYLGLKKISLEVTNENEKALKLYKNVGFTEEGILKEQYYYNGRFYNIHRLAIIRD